MSLPALTTPVPHSVGLNRPQRLLPPGACDSHMHIFDARFAPSAHWPRTPPDAPVAAYRQLQQRLGTSRAVVVTPSTYGTHNACTFLSPPLATLHNHCAMKASPWNTRKPQRPLMA